MNLFWLVILTLSPIVEVRGGIPLMIVNGYKPWVVLIIAILCSIIIFIFNWFMLSMFYTFLFSRLKVFRWIVEHTRKVSQPYLKLGAIGLMLFVAIPLPMTGIYTGTLIAWLLGMKVTKGLIVIVSGGILASLLVLLLTMSGIYLF